MIKLDGRARLSTVGRKNSKEPFEEDQLIEDWLTGYPVEQEGISKAYQRAVFFDSEAGLSKLKKNIQLSSNGNLKMP